MDAFSQKRRKEKLYINIKYEKFNLEDISVDGETGVPVLLV